jgi:Uma2 family endonuclease
MSTQAQLMTANELLVMPGSRLVWVVSPKLHTVTVYRSLTEIVVLTENDTLDGGVVVPGFQISIAEIFA